MYIYIYVYKYIYIYIYICIYIFKITNIVATQSFTAVHGRSSSD